MDIYKICIHINIHLLFFNTSYQKQVADIESQVYMFINIHVCFSVLISAVVEGRTWEQEAG